MYTSRVAGKTRRSTKWSSLGLRLAVAIAMVASLIGLTVSPTSTAALTTTGLVRPTDRPVVVRSGSEIEVGVKFSSSRAGQVAGIRAYVGEASSDGHRVILWNSGGKVLAKSHFVPDATGWQTLTFDAPVAIEASRTYVISYNSPTGSYAKAERDFTSPRTDEPLTALGMVYRDGRGFPQQATENHHMVDVRFTYDSDGAPPASPSSTTSPTTSPTASPTATPTSSPTPSTPPSSPTSGDWPNASNTGVPGGTNLSAYTGPCTITASNTVIDARTVNCTLNIQASNVRITRSRINGRVDVRSASSGHSFTITDSEVHIGDNLNTGLMRANFRANRVEVTGGRRSMYCENNCVIENSWVHAQGGDPGGDAHFSGIRMSQNTTIRHNTITCEAQRGSGTGCSAGLTGYGDFAPVTDNLIENNIFLGGGGGGSTVCAYGGSSGGKPYSSGARNIRFLNNVFVRGATGKCGNLGAIFSFDRNAPGNVWSGNTWDSGATLLP